LYKIFEQINEKFRAGINGYFCIKKSSILMGMCISLIEPLSFLKGYNFYLEKDMLFVNYMMK
jgi:hypothetical protein